MERETEDAVLAELRANHKVEWGIILALVINVVTAAFGVGVYFNTIAEQGRRITQLESDRNLDRKALAGLSETLIRIDTNIEFLTKRAEEDRRIIYQRRGL